MTSLSRIRPGHRAVHEPRAGPLVSLRGTFMSLTRAGNIELGREMPVPVPASLGLALPRGPLPARRLCQCIAPEPRCRRHPTGPVPLSRSHWPAAAGRLGPTGTGRPWGYRVPARGPNGIGQPGPGDSRPRHTAAYYGPWQRPGALTRLRSLESRPCAAARRAQAGSRWSTSTARAVVRACALARACMRTGTKTTRRVRLRRRTLSSLSTPSPAADRCIAADDQAPVRLAAAMPPARRDAA
jgi:hypothetical protein